MEFKLLHKNEILPLENVKLPKFIVTANAWFINEANTNRRFMNICNKYYSTFDGAVPLKIARIVLKTKNIEKISGSDLGYDFCKYAKKNNMSVFLLGGDKRSNRVAVNNIQEEFKIRISGFSPNYEQYPFSTRFCETCLDAIRQFKPDILFVGFGAPKQEYFIDDHFETLNEVGVKYVIGCGGTIDFLAGKIKRAPVFIQKSGLEGVYRFLKEPNKMRFKRLLNSFRFLKFIYCKPKFETRN